MDTTSTHRPTALEIFQSELPKLGYTLADDVSWFYDKTRGNLARRLKRTPTRGEMREAAREAIASIAAKQRRFSTVRQNERQCDGVDQVNEWSDGE